MEMTCGSECGMFKRSRRGEYDMEMIKPRIAPVNVPLATAGEGTRRGFLTMPWWD
jgi:hypothetical protein